MPSIDLSRPHHTDRQQARLQVDALARRMGEKFGIQAQWEGDTLRLRHAGLEGGITVDDESVHVTARLGMLMGALKPRIERELREKLDDCFGPARRA